MKSAKIAILVAAAISIATVLAILCDGFIMQKIPTFSTPGMAIAAYIVSPSHRYQIPTIFLLIDSLLWFVILCSVFAAVRAFRRKSR
jgi:dolichyl-phosphate-mannose--protein O-mannosyl transferase